jgi:hypothetical protein
MSSAVQSRLVAGGLVLALVLQIATWVTAEPDGVSISAVQIASLLEAQGSARLDAAKELGLLGKLAAVNGIEEAATASMLATQNDLEIMPDGSFFYSCFKGDLHEYIEWQYYYDYYCCRATRGADYQYCRAYGLTRPI